MPKAKNKSSRAVKLEHESSAIILGQRPQNTEHVEVVWDDVSKKLKVVYEKS
jgi:hypothetical protein